MKEPSPAATPDPAASSPASFSSILKHAGIYGIGSVGIRIAGLFLVPLYTYNLTVAEYGVIEYLDLTAVGIGMLFSLGLSNAIFRFYYMAPPGEDRRRVISTALGPVLALSFAVAAGLFLLAPALADWLFHDPRFVRYLRILFVGFGFNMVAEFGMGYLALLHRSATFSAITIVKFLVGVALNVAFLIALRWGVEGILISNLITNTALGALLLVWVIRENGVAFDGSLCRRMIAYGYPLVLVQVALFGINFADRFFLQASGGFEQVGIYALAYKFGIMLNTLVVANFFQVWVPKSFEIATEPGAGAFYTRVFGYFTVGLLAAGVGMALMIRDVIGLVAPPAYAPAAILVPLIAAAYVANGVGTFFELGIKLENRTSLLGWIYGGTCALCLALYALLIPRYGMFGAVVATVLAFTAKAIAVERVSQRVHPIRYEFGRFARAAFLGAGVVALRMAIPPLPLAASIAVGLALFAAFLGALWTFGIGSGERAAAASWLRQRLQAFRGAEPPVAG